MPKFMDICTKKDYSDKVTGQKKTAWPECGTLRIFEDGKMYIEWNDRPDITYFVFERDKKEPVQ